MPATDRPRGFVMWPADFLSDPAVAAMDTTEVGAFWLLCLYAAQSEPPGTLPNDDALLARLTRLGDRWPDHRDRVLRAWSVGPKLITQKRLAQEVEASRRRRDAKSRAGKMRWNTELSHGAHAPLMHRTSYAREGVGVGVEEAESKARPEPAAAASNDPNGSEPGDAPPDAPAGTAGAFPSEPGASRDAVLGLLNGLAGSMRLAPSATPTKVAPTAPAWEWLRANTTPGRADEAMKLVGWLMSTGTRDGNALLALVKDFVVHEPRNPHAYYTPNGTARQNIVMRVHADRAIAEHERIKREEREFLGGSR